MGGGDLRDMNSKAIVIFIIAMIFIIWAEVTK